MTNTYSSTELKDLTYSGPLIVAPLFFNSSNYMTMIAVTYLKTLPNQQSPHALPTTNTFFLLPNASIALD